MKRTTTLLYLALLAGAACEETTEVLQVEASRPECENLNPQHCLVPWPSSRYLVDDPSTITGKRIALLEAAMPANRWGETVTPDPYNRHDGFSPMTSMMTVFDGELDTSTLPAEDRVADSLAADSPTVLLDAVTGERVPHFSEINEWQGTDLAHAAFYIRPAVRLKEGHHYIAAVRSLRKKDGSGVQPSAYFLALRDKRTASADEVEARRGAFETIFTKLTDAGVDRGTLLEAWDFHTASGQSAWRDLVAMRDDAMMRVGAGGLGCTVTSTVQDDGNAHIYRKVLGTFTVPLYMTTAEPGAVLNRGPDGLPKYNGTAEARFTAIIPKSVEARVGAGGAPARLLTYGHGLMGDGGEVGSSFQRGFLDRFQIVGVATDWWGMSEPDTNNVAEALGQLGDFPTVAERLTQGVINTLVLTRSFAGVCGQLPEMQVNGRSVIDPTEKYYLGISQGSIMGTTTAALSQDIDRFILNVGGISYPIMIIRSVDFPDYNMVLQAWYNDKLDTDLLMVMLASLWDLAEPATYASHLLTDPLPNTPVKRILYQIGRYDAQVPNISSDIAARTIGLPVMTPSVYDVWNLETTAGPADSAYVIYDVGADPVPLGSRAAEMDNVAHERVRRTESAQLQMDAFMAPDGVVNNYCTGPCDPD